MKIDICSQHLKVVTVIYGPVIWPLSWLISNKPQVRRACNPLNYPGVFTRKNKVRIHSQCWLMRLNCVIVLQFFLFKLTILVSMTRLNITKLHSDALITFWMLWNEGSLIKLVLVALSGFWSVFPTWQVADVVVFSVPPGRHHYRIIWRMCHIMGKLSDDIAAACKSLVVLCDLSWWPRKEYCNHICCLAK